MGVFKRSNQQGDSLTPAQMLACLGAMRLRALARDGALWVAADAPTARLLDACCTGSLEGGPGTAEQLAALVGVSTAPGEQLEAHAALLQATRPRHARRRGGPHQPAARSGGAGAPPPPPPPPEAAQGCVAAADDAGGALTAVRLGPEEAFFLHHVLGCLAVQGPAPLAAPLDAQALWTWCSARAEGFAATYAAYRHVRAKGWVARPGLLYGADFVLYRGHPRSVHSDFVALVVAHLGGGGGGGALEPRRRWARCDAPLAWVDAQIAQRLAQQVFKRLLLVHVVAAEGGVDVSRPDAVERLAVCEVAVQRWVPNISRTAAAAAAPAAGGGA